MCATWTSKLCNKYPMEEIQKLDLEHHRELGRLRKEPHNTRCAECDDTGVSWASVNLGIFICIRCADVHRALGTHVSKVKGCSGTYLWGPDEIENVRCIGNLRSATVYGGADTGAKPAVDASKDERVAICRKKYEQLAFAPRNEQKSTKQAAGKRASLDKKSVEEGTNTITGASEVGVAALWPAPNEPAAQVDLIDWGDNAVTTGAVHCWPSSNGLSKCHGLDSCSSNLWEWPQSVGNCSTPSSANQWDPFSAWAKSAAPAWPPVSSAGPVCGDTLALDPFRATGNGTGPARVEGILMPDQLWSDLKLY